MLGNFPWHAACMALIAVLTACSTSDSDPVVLFEHGNYDASLAIFEQRAAAGDIIATNYLGMHYYLGAGVERNFEKAAKLFEIAALAEHPGAQRNLGVMFLRGLGVPQDNHQAYGWLYFAYKGGNAGAQEYLRLISDNVTPNAAGVARKRVRSRIVAAAHAARAEAATAATD
jgi:TPR repeat protein